MQYLFFSQTFFPSCFHHAALSQMCGSDGSGHGRDFLWVWGLPSLWGTVISHV